MKKQLLHFASALSLCLMLGGVATAQMTRQMTVTVPFAFYVGKTELPAGTYTVYGTSTNTGDGFLLRDAEGHAKALFTGQQVLSRASHSVARLEFQRDSNGYFLTRVWAAGSNIGRELLQSNLERETARGDRRQQTTESSKTEVITVTTQ